MKKILIILSVMSLFVAQIASADNNNGNPDLSFFKNYYEPKLPEIKLATPVKITLNKEMSYGIAVLEKETGNAQYWVKEKMTLPEINEQIPGGASNLIGNPKNLIDKDLTTEAEFNLDQDKGEAFLIIKFQKPLTSDELQLSLGLHTALPHEMEIKAEVNGNWKTVVSRTKMNGQNVYFPSTTAQKWRLNFWHGQPLIVKEITFVDQKQKEIFKGENYVWLARPGEEYLVYVDAQTSFNIATEEGGDLWDKERTVSAEIGQVKTNPLFKEPDDDQDGVINLIDNCVNIPNKDQTDLDNNGRGDACEDHDGDSVMDSKDNCPDHPNRYQENIDNDQYGDACDDKDNRMGESYPWLPWAAMGAAAVIVLAIIVQTVRKSK